METLQPVARPLGRERAMSDTFSSRPRPGLGRELLKNGNNPRKPDENRSTSTLPKAFESMLKTTTETGDIGMFSIKPSRVPQSSSTPRRPVGNFNDNGLQRPKPSFQPYGVPIVDDRRRLPSYARDAAPDVLSMYETASQKSASRIFEEPDYRSYSMTQTSYSSYTLSNHRSYASLRSQPERNAGTPNGAVGLLQRPRSPFAYPTRLRRPGFRPSSPALTDGGLVDYSRRAEIERYPYGSGHSTSSPSSLYALKRKPPLGMRPEGNRSTPSLLSQPSPHRRSSSPQVSQGFTSSGQDWSRRNGFASVNTSPARSTLSLASTTNLYASATVASTTNTPGKAPSSSPLYYDYTEDFEVESYKTPSVLGSPPQFTIDRTIPEERPMSAHVQDIGPRMLESCQDNGLRISLPLPGKQQRPLHLAALQDSVTSPTCQVEESIQLPNKSWEELGGTLASQSNGSKRDTKIIRLSGLGYGARELSTHVEEAFGLTPSAAFEVPVSEAEEATKIDSTTQYPKSAERRETHSEPFRTSLSEDHNAHQQYFSEPIVNLEVTTKSFAIDSKPRGDSSALQQPSRNSTLLQSRSHRQSQESIVRKELPAQALPGQRVRSSDFSSETGFSELLELITTPGAKNEPRSSAEQSRVPREQTTITSTTIPHELNLRRATSDRRMSPPVSAFSCEMIGDGKSNQPSVQPNQEYKQQRRQRLPPAVGARPPLTKAQNFSHQIANNSMARTDPPMLAPKPISPARQLKLKNSIPQLMKALPPLPPEPTFQTDSPPPRRRIAEKGPLGGLPPTPAQKASSIPENGTATDAQSQKELPPHHIQRPQTESRVELALLETGDVNPQPLTIEQVESELPLPPPKMKLKVKSSSVLRPLTPPEPSPWSAQEEHLLANEDTDASLPPVLQNEEQSNGKRPRFKLRVIRASDSNRGTVRINRNSGDSSKQAAALLQRCPRDLFTPVTGIDNMFRQVSKHIHSRRASTNSNFLSESEHGSIPSSTPHTLSTTESNPLSPLTAPSSNATNSYETRSAFSDDSSIEGQNSLRRRLTDFRAKMAVPYVSKLGTHSYDDIVWKDRKGGEHPIPMAARSIPNLHGSRASAETKPMRRFAERFHRQRLRTKMQNWLKGARAAIAARMRSRSAS